MTSCSNVAKCLLIFTGICYLAAAGGLSYIGIWVFSTYDHFDEIADSTLTLLPASIILGVSVFMCVIGILSCLAAFKSSKLLLSVFFSLILLVFVGEVSAAALGYFYRTKVEGVLEDNLNDAINEYNVTVYKEQIDYMQQEFKCCGVHNFTDWFTSTYWKHEAGKNKTLPESCCKKNTTCSYEIDPKAVYLKGCLDQIEKEFHDNLVYIAGSVVFIAVIQLLALISTCILVCRTRAEGPIYHSLNEQTGGGLRV